MSMTFSKHVEDCNKHIINKRIVRQVGHLLKLKDSM